MSQRGLAMLAIIVLLALISAYLIASGINRSASEIAVEKDRQTEAALRQARAALIAFSASRAWNVEDETDQPGSLPCPDINDDGVADAIPDCSSAASRVGRFPWKTVGAPELRDASGETLWYAVSADFRTRSNTTVVNSDTQGELTVVGTAPQSNVVALLIAPGPPVQDPLLSGQVQNRSAANVNRVASYLEDKNASGTDTYTDAAPGSNGVYVPTASTYNSMHQSEAFFNDRLLAVTQADLMAVVEPAVAARIERSVKPFLDTYFLQWGAFPFPAKFDDPSPGANIVPPNAVPPPQARTQDQYIGDTTQTSGLLPITAFASNPTPYPWTAGSGTVTLTSGIAGSISGASCTTVNWPFTGWKCSFDITSLDSSDVCGSHWQHYCMVNPSFKVTGEVGANAGKSFAKLPDVSAVTVTSSYGSTRNMSSTAISGSLASSGVGTVNFQGTYSYTYHSNDSFTRSMVVTIPDVTVSPLTASDSTNPNAGFFIRNEWYRQVIYAVAPGYLPGGSGSCTPGSTCLTVNGLPSRYTTSNDKHAILILAGRSLNGSARPSAKISDYLEGSNVSALYPPYAFEDRIGAPTTINDRVIVMCSNVATITDATDTSPISITTSTALALANGADVTISGVDGNTAANGGWTATVTDSTHFTLDGSSGNGSYTSGGALCY